MAVWMEGSSILLGGQTATGLVVVVMVAVVVVVIGIVVKTKDPVRNQREREIIGGIFV